MEEVTILVFLAALVQLTFSDREEKGLIPLQSLFFWQL